MKKVAILQSNYIPWKGYFDLINSVDEFIFYDEMQYTKNDWRNRNKIKTNNGLSWLTIAVNQTGGLNQKINETFVSDERWKKKHFETIKQFYGKAKCYKSQIDFITNLYLNCNYSKLSDINKYFIIEISRFLGIKTNFSSSEDYGLIEGKTERLVDLVIKAGAGEYISGPSAKDYLNEKLFENEGIKVSWMDYSGYENYNQLYPPFEHGVSILDLILNEGLDSTKYMKSFK